MTNLPVIFAVIMAISAELAKAGEDKKYTVNELVNVAKVAVDAAGIGEIVVVDFAKK